MGRCSWMGRSARTVTSVRQVTPAAGPAARSLVDTHSLSGSGRFEANGGTGNGNNGGGGGGGRIAVYYTAGAGFSGYTNCSAKGGTAALSSYYGQVGTVVFFDVSVSNSHLYVYENCALGTVTNRYGALTVRDGGTLAAGEQSSLTIDDGFTLDETSRATLGGATVLDVGGELRVTNTSLVVLQGVDAAAQVSNEWVGTGVRIEAGSLFVDAGSRISANAQGYLGSSPRGRGKGPGGGGESSSRGGGGGHGGAGGTVGPALGGSAYGSVTEPTDLGSGGGTYSLGGGNGGGALRLSVDGMLLLDGTISANGASGSAAYAGGGSGGSIWVDTASLSGSGRFEANGGTGNNNSGGGGGGGRIAVYYAQANGFSGYTNSTASGGAGASASYDGKVGTVGFFDVAVSNFHLSVYENYAMQSTQITLGGITVRNGGTLQAGEASVLDVAGDMTLAQSARFTCGGRSTLMVGGTLCLTNASVLVTQGADRDEPVSNRWVGRGLTVHAGDVAVSGDSRVSADGYGYRGGSVGAGAGPGGGGRAASSGGGGGHGGPGRDCGSAKGGGIYGFASRPTDLGSGGGAGGPAGGSGGGAIRLIVDGTFALDGTVSADGGNATVSYGGGGAGGSIWVDAGVLNGDGWLKADGGDGHANGGGGGGGGRIAVYYWDGIAWPTGNVSMAAGQGSCPGVEGRYVDDRREGARVVDQPGTHPPLLHGWHERVCEC